MIKVRDLIYYLIQVIVISCLLGAVAVLTLMRLMQLGWF